MNINERVVNLLIEKRLIISSAESCTGGMFAKLITDISGSSAVLNESYITYANEAKTKLLGVKKETLAQYGAVSEQTAQEMADGLYRVTSADICIVFTGIAGPGGGTPEKPVGLVYTAICFKGKTTVYKLMLSGSRDEIRTQACLEMFKKIEKMLL